MNYHVILTRRCNLNCTYCHGGEESVDTEIQYTIDQLAVFLEKDTTPIVLMLYGGEPLLRIPLVTELMERFPNAIFMLQTNALLIDRLPIKYLDRFNSILVSIDGAKDVTDGYRSKGVYDKVLKSVRWLRKNDYSGDVVARMAVSQQSDIYREVRHLIELEDPEFDHVHWQLNVVWDAEGNWTDFDGWVQESYKPGIEMLVRDWVSSMAYGTVEGIVPFIPLMYSLLTGQGSDLRCGSGIDTFAIHVDGSIGICPISPDWEFSIVGNIIDTDPEELDHIMTVDEPCPSCEEYSICGGRCLFANKQRLWGEEGFRKICDLVKHLVQTLRDQVPIVKELLRNGTLSIEQFQYPAYNNGCEIIP